MLLLFAAALWPTGRGFCGPATTNGTVSAVSVVSTSAVPVYGRLESVRVVLEQTDENITFRPEDIRPPRWYFPRMNADSVLEVLRSTGLSEAQLALLKQPGVINEDKIGAVVLPPKALVFGLSPEVRAAVYAKLAEFSLNDKQRYPFQFLESDVDEWRESGVLSVATTELIKRLSFQRSGMMCLSDTQMASDIPFFERSAFLRVLTRVPSLVVKLNVDRKSDIEALASYWGAAGRKDEVRSVLKAMSEVDGGSKMDLTRILPPFARMRLFTFPDAMADSSAAYQDCFWTALNFFNTTPKDFFGDPAKTGAWIREHYTPVKDEPRYGDVVMMMDAEGNAIHACVYLADKIVFTKNGKGLNKPWILMNMDEMLRTYLAHVVPGSRLQVVAFRLK